VVKKLLLATLLVASAIMVVAALVPASYDDSAYIQNPAGAGGAATAQPPVRQASPTSQPRQNAAIVRTAPTYPPSGQGQGGSGGSGTDASGSGGTDASGSGGTAEDGWTTLSAAVTGDAEVPGPGAPGATGQVAVRIKGNRICFQESWSSIKAIASHIHRGARGVAGPTVVPFFKATTPLAGDSATGCVTVDPTLARELGQRPGSFYVNVHTVELPAGAIRGQLALAAGAGRGSLPRTGVQTRIALLVGLVATGCGFLLVTLVRRRPAVAARHARGSVRR